MTKRITAIAFLALIVNSAYIAAFADPSIFYMANVLLHLGLGLALMVVAVIYARRHPVESVAFLLAGLPAGSPDKTMGRFRSASHWVTSRP